MDEADSRSTAPADALSGLSVEETRAEFEEVCRRLRESNNLFFGTAQVKDLEIFLQRPDLQPAERVEALLQLARDYLRLGEEERAIQMDGEALRVAADSNLDVRVQLQALAELGLGFLRIAEVTNCIGMHNPAMCIFPIGAGGRHRDPEAAREALRAFNAVLAGVPEYSMVEWLANVAAMTVGSFPDSLKPSHRVPADRLRSEQDFPRFVDAAHKAGLMIFDPSGGAIVDDLDGDGYLDVLTSSIEACTPMRFFRSDGAGRFHERTREAGLDGQLGGLNMIQTDYNNDGYRDILVLRGGWLGHDGRMRNSLLRNNRDGTFSDVTFAAGVGDTAYPTQTADWADYDLDGDLDLYIGNEAMADNLNDPSKIGNVRDPYPSELYRNNGDGTFTNVTLAAGVENRRFAKGVAWGDYDNDGDPDLAVSNIGPNRLYLNNGDGTFTDIAPVLGLDKPTGRTFPTWWFDYDNDGDEDLFIADYNGAVEDVTDYYLGDEAEIGVPRIYRNDAGRGLVEVGRSLGLKAPALTMGANFGDLDNDGFLDFYLGTGQPTYESIVPNLMYRNDAGKAFLDVTFSGGFGHLQKGHGVAFADIDNDGDQDVFEQIGGAYPGDAYNSVLFENPGNDNDWVTLELIGVTSNRVAIGARVRITVRDSSGLRDIYRTVGTGGSFGGSPLRVEVGLGRLGEDKRIERIEVTWPGGGRPQTFSEIDANAFYKLREGDSQLEPVRLRSFALGGEGEQGVHGPQ